MYINTLNQEVNKVMKLFYQNVDLPKLEDEIKEECKRKVCWLFPDITKSFPAIIDNGKVIIDPNMYYVTSGEAINKTIVLISDVKELMSVNTNKLTELTDLFMDLNEFLELLKTLKGPSRYLEITKCDDGIYSGNVCARKDLKKKKIVQERKDEKHIP